MTIYFGAHYKFGHGQVLPIVRLLNGFIYIPIGMILGLKYSSIIKTNENKFNLIKSTTLILIIICLLAHCVFRERIVNDFFTLLFSISFFVFIIQFDMSTSIETKSLRTVSAVVYFIHLYIWTVYYSIMYGEKNYGIDSFIVSSMVSILIGYIYYKLKWRITDKKNKHSF